MATTDFGRDTYCADSLRTGRFASGPLQVGLACYRRLKTPRGMLRGGPEEEAYGLDLCAEVGKVVSEAHAASLPDKIRNELKEDERLLTVDIRIDRTVSGPETHYAIEIDGGTDDGPFRLKLAASAVTLELVGLTEGGT